MTAEIISGFIDPTRNEQVLVGTTAVKVCDARVRQAPRTVLLIRNISSDVTAVITVNLSFNQVTASTGIVLQNGESFSDTTDSGYQSFQGQITAVCNNANGILAVFER